MDLFFYTWFVCIEKRTSILKIGFQFIISKKVKPRLWNHSISSVRAWVCYFVNDRKCLYHILVYTKPIWWSIMYYNSELWFCSHGQIQSCKKTKDEKITTTAQQQNENSHSTHTHTIGILREFLSKSLTTVVWNVWLRCSIKRLVEKVESFFFAGKFIDKFKFNVNNDWI